MALLSALRPVWLLAVLTYLVYLSLTSKTISTQVTSVVPEKIQHRASDLRKAAHIDYPFPSFKGRNCKSHTAGGKNVNAAKTVVHDLLQQPLPNTIWQTSDFERRRKNVKNIASWHKLNPNYKLKHLSGMHETILHCTAFDTSTDRYLNRRRQRRIRAQDLLAPALDPAHLELALPPRAQVRLPPLPHGPSQGWHLHGH